MDASIASVNLGTANPSPNKRDPLQTGIDKRPTLGRIEVRSPGPKQGGLGSGLVGDFIGDGRHHGGDDQAIYAFQREDLDRWEQRLGRTLTNGFFGENLTTVGLEINDMRLGTVWRIGDTVEVQVTWPRIPCNTFRGWVGEKGWLKSFTADSRPGAYLRILTPGFVAAGDVVTILSTPEGGPTIAETYLIELGLA